MNTTIPVNSPAPDFSLPDQAGKKHRLKDYRGKYVVLYFYPDDDTPLCTTEACQFRDGHADFAAHNAVVLGVSPNTPAEHDAFAAKFSLPFPLLADVPAKNAKPPVCEAYGVWGEKNMYGKIVVGMIRTTYLIDPKGNVAHRWDRVKTPGHAQAVLDALLQVQGAAPVKKSPPKPAPKKAPAGKAAKRKTPVRAK
ncbi:MAG: peroxiredoxin [Planctomycetes bacterium]|nr:peroxiredoxin [Planctomycetota bacterium]